MGNVLKYEIKRSRFMMLIVGIIIGGLELAYLIGFFGVKTAQNEKIQDIFSSIWIFSIVLLVIAACCSMLVGVLYSVLLYNSDIRKKSGYMLFPYLAVDSCKNPDGCPCNGCSGNCLCHFRDCRYSAVHSRIG